MAREFSYGVKPGGAGVGFGRESTYGTEQAREANRMLRIIRDDIRVVDPQEDLPDIQNNGNAPARDRDCTYGGMTYVEGRFDASYNYRGFDPYFANMLGDPTQTVPEAGSFQKVYSDQIDMGTPLTTEFFKGASRLECYGTDVERLAFNARNESVPLEAGVGILSKSGARINGAGTPTFIAKEPALMQHYKLEVDIGAGYLVLPFDTFSLEMVKTMAKEMTKDGTGDRSIRRPHRTGYADYSGVITRKMGEQDSAVMDESGIWDLYLGGQSTVLKIKFSCIGDIIVGSTRETLILEMAGTKITSPHGPGTDGPGPREERIEFSALAKGSTEAVKITTINADDGTAWANGL